MLWSEERFTIKKDKNTASWTYGISDLNGEETVGIFYKKIAKSKSKKVWS